VIQLGGKDLLERRVAVCHEWADIAGEVRQPGKTGRIGADGRRQLSVALNLQRWNRLDATGKPQPHPIDAALYQVAMYE
jgi:hypothetical protein